MSNPGTGDPAWISLASVLQNGWANVGAPFPLARYRRYANKQVDIQGLVGSGVQTANTVIATLPAGYRPGGNLIRTCAVNNAGGVITLQVLPNGNIQIQGAANPAGSVSWIDLSALGPFLAES